MRIALSSSPLSRSLRASWARARPTATSAAIPNEGRKSFDGLALGIPRPETLGSATVQPFPSTVVLLFFHSQQNSTLYLVKQARRSHGLSHGPGIFFHTSLFAAVTLVSFSVRLAAQLALHSALLLSQVLLYCCLCIVQLYRILHSVSIMLEKKGKSRLPRSPSGLEFLHLGRIQNQAPTDSKSSTQMAFLPWTNLHSGPVHVVAKSGAGNSNWV